MKFLLLIHVVVVWSQIMHRSRPVSILQSESEENLVALYKSKPMQRGQERVTLTPAYVSAYVWKRVRGNAQRSERQRGQGWGTSVDWGDPMESWNPSDQASSPVASATYGGAARTASTGLRRPGGCRGKEGGARGGQRATNKISSTVCPLWERGVSFHPFCLFCSFASQGALAGSHLLTFAYAPNARPGESARLSFKFSILIPLTRQPRRLEVAPPKLSKVPWRYARIQGR